MMLNILILSFKNIFRNKRRTLITLASLWISGAVIIVLKGYMDYTFFGLKEITIRSNLGHIQVYKKGFLENGKDNKLLLTRQDVSHLNTALQNQKEKIEIITERLGFTGIIMNGERQSFFVGDGVIPKNEREVSSNIKIIDGNDSIKKREIVIGEFLAKDLKIKKGDNITLITNTIHGSINAMDFKVRGIISTGIRDLDEKIIRVTLEDAQNLLSTDSVEKIVILLDNTEDTESAIKSLQMNEEFTFKPWMEMADYYFQVVHLYKNLFKFIITIIFIIIIFGVMNTITMSVMERIPEIGILRSLGTFKKEIFLIFLFEGFFIGILGSMGGILFGTILSFIINLSGGIYMSSPPGHTEGYYILINLSFYSFLISFLVCTLSSTIAGTFGAIKAYKLKVINAINYV